MAFKGRVKLAQVAPNHPFAKPQIGFAPRPSSDSKNSSDQSTVGEIPPQDWDAALEKTLKANPSEGGQVPVHSASSSGTTPPKSGSA